MRACGHGLLAVAAWLCLSACTSAQPAKAPPVESVRLGPPMTFDLEALDGTRVTSENTRGRNTVMGFITTYDLASQALANFLITVSREHVPRTNVVAVVLEREESRPLVKAYADTLHLRFPVVMLDPREQHATAFKDMVSVPSVLVIDRQGRPFWRKNGIVDAKELDQVLRSIE